MICTILWYVNNSVSVEYCSNLSKTSNQNVIRPKAALSFFQCNHGHILTLPDMVATSFLCLFKQLKYGKYN